MTPLDVASDQVAIIRGARNEALAAKEQQAAMQQPAEREEMPGEGEDMGIELQIVELKGGPR